MLRIRESPFNREHSDKEKEQLIQSRESRRLAKTYINLDVAAHMLYDETVLKSPGIGFPDLFEVVDAEIRDSTYGKVLALTITSPKCISLGEDETIPEFTPCFYESL
jgi:hypothetical protein